ncbi:MAG: phosphoribosyl-AMP cyclohydrolase [Actinomycetota bacterium]
MREIDLSSVKFNSLGLVPVVVQDAATKDVLMLAYTNRECLEETIEMGQMVYFSRSRNSRWHKGATSGNFQEVVSLSQDCDGDTILALVHPNGPSCHNGTSTCFEEN